MQANPYLAMPIERVRNDALHGVRAAREAWRTRDPAGAARELGRIVERPIVADDTRERQARILQAMSDFQKKPRHLRQGYKSMASK